MKENEKDGDSLRKKNQTHEAIAKSLQHYTVRNDNTLTFLYPNSEFKPMSE